jgi:hypothetical protein
MLQGFGNVERREIAAGMKGRARRRRLDVAPIENERVDVHVQVERAAEALQDG